jgi:uncharacterized membrane protein YdjX (TVP38/TMEM64 family)
LKRIIFPLLLFLLLAILIFSLNYFNVLNGIRIKVLALMQWVESLGSYSLIAFIVFYIFATIFLLSGSFLTMAAGAVFGIGKAVLVVSLGSIAGATAAFFLSRYFFRNFIAHLIVKNKKFISIDNAVEKEGWKIIGLARLSPVLPSVLLNYTFGITKVSLRDFILATWIGMLPMITFFSYLGSFLGSLATIENTERTRTPIEWLFYLLGLIATVAVALYTTRLANRVLKEKIIKDNSEDL